MIEQVYRCDFVKRFQDIRPNQFSRTGLDELFNYLTYLEQDTGEQIEFDCIALCCEFVEYENLTELTEDYRNIFEESYNDDDLSDIEKSDIIEILERYTEIIHFSKNCILIKQF